MQGMSGKKGVVTLVGSQKERALLAPLIPGHDLHEKGLQRQKYVVPLVGSQEHRAFLVLVINR